MKNLRNFRTLDNLLGWGVFVVALITYMLTLEPTASFWDCPEFIAQGYKCEIGHPPGNPIFILAARFLANFVSGPSQVAWAVNAMSGIFSALTILFLFWSITHLTKKLVMGDDDDENSLSLSQLLVIMGSGVCGALVYAWSDTFWFSAVEAEVYAFSSFCTALVFWVILKWEDHADDPGSDRYLILIAYLIGAAVAVHLLNLLCIPAIVLVFYYRKFKETNVKGSLIALCVSFVIIALILFGLVPGFVRVAGWFEKFAVNDLGMPFNSGVLAYVVLDFVVFAWTIYEIYRQQNPLRIKISFMLTAILSGLLIIGNGFLLPLMLIAALAVYLFYFCKRIPSRILGITAISILVIFIGYSSYALIIIRSTANPPLDENSPDNVFSLSSYINREQYGQTPLLYGRTFDSDIVYEADGNGNYRPKVASSKEIYAKEVSLDSAKADRYVVARVDKTQEYTPELNMLFPRMHDDKYKSQYKEWLGVSQFPIVEATTILNVDGTPLQSEMKEKPTFMQNLQFFIDYQLNYMYWRYFMWNFVGRQNDIQGMGEITHGNWVSGIPFIDNWRLGDQSLLPDDLGKGNKGHNVFFMLPLLLGIIGLLWQAYAGKKGIEQFWVVFFLFFMTGIAIVLYLNQTPSQPRERDYAYAGSFYAFAIWVGMGVAGLWRLILAANKKAKKQVVSATGAAIAAAVVGLIVPLQMVSQTWDDHDRSGRYVARDFGYNYLQSADENAILFCNGDNDTFPLWYNQEVEGVRTDVRVVNLSYLTTGWYYEQMLNANYEAAPLPTQGNKTTFAYDRRTYTYILEPNQTPVPAIEALRHTYSDDARDKSRDLYILKYPAMYIPIDKAQALKMGRVAAKDSAFIEDVIDVNVLNTPAGRRGAINAAELLTIDFLASSIEQGWTRPMYFAKTVPVDYYMGLERYMRNTGMCYEVTPLYTNKGDDENIPADTDKGYDNVMNKFRWGGLDTAKPGSLYLDETVRRMVASHRLSINDIAYELISEGIIANHNAEKAATDSEKAELSAYAKERLTRAKNILAKMEESMPEATAPYDIQFAYSLSDTYKMLSQNEGFEDAAEKSKQLLLNEMRRIAQYSRYYQSLNQWCYSRLTKMDRYIDQIYFPNLIVAWIDQCPSTDQWQKDVDALLTEFSLNKERVMNSVNKVLQQLYGDDTSETDSTTTE